MLRDFDFVDVEGADKLVDWPCTRRIEIK